MTLQDIFTKSFDIGRSITIRCESTKEVKDLIKKFKLSRPGYRILNCSGGPNINYQTREKLDNSCKLFKVVIDSLRWDEKIGKINPNYITIIETYNKENEKFIGDGRTALNSNAQFFSYKYIMGLKEFDDSIESIFLIPEKKNYHGVRDTNITPGKIMDGIERCKQREANRVAREEPQQNNQRFNTPSVREALESLRNTQELFGE